MSQLAESYPIRRAAQLGAYLFFRGKQLRMFLHVYFQVKELSSKHTFLLFVVFSDKCE